MLAIWASGSYLLNTMKIPADITSKPKNRLAVSAYCWAPAKPKWSIRLMAISWPSSTKETALATPKCGATEVMLRM